MISYKGVICEPIDELFVSRCHGDKRTLEKPRGRVDVDLSENKRLVAMTHAYRLWAMAR